jgi:hypothetical protein
VSLRVRLQRLQLKNTTKIRKLFDRPASWRRVGSWYWYFDCGADLQELVDLSRVDVWEAPVVVHMGRGDKIVGVYAPP